MLTANREITSPAVRYYFDNLLPDNPQIRDRMRRRFAIRSADTFDLLEALGRDCVGAVQLLPEGAQPAGWNRIETDALKAADVEAILTSVTATGGPAGSPQQELRISIAGNQEKTALLKIGRTWYRPRGSTPTTHILKLPLGIIGGMNLDMTHSVDNEWLCAHLLAELGLPVASTEIGRFGDQRVLVVERFDRRWQSVGDADPKSTRFEPPASAWIARLPQEDFCQATGRSLEQKYETDGGAGIAEILGILARAERPEADRRTFALAQLCFWMLAAIDGHSKNFSIYHGRAGTFSLTPLYDVLSAWPVIGDAGSKIPLKRVKLAMALPGKRYELRDIQPRHFKQLADMLGDDELWPKMLALAERVPQAIGRVEARLPKDFAASVWTSVTKGLKQQAKTFRAPGHRPDREIMGIRIFTSTPSR
jgi:serine/threonine-protein kinase HipA